MASQILIFTWQKKAMLLQPEDEVMIPMMDDCWFGAVSWYENKTTKDFRDAFRCTSNFQVMIVQVGFCTPTYTPCHQGPCFRACHDHGTFFHSEWQALCIISIQGDIMKSCSASNYHYHWFSCNINVYQLPSISSVGIQQFCWVAVVTGGN